MESLRQSGLSNGGATSWELDSAGSFVPNGAVQIGAPGSGVSGIWTNSLQMDIAVGVIDPLPWYMNIADGLIILNEIGGVYSLKLWIQGAWKELVFTDVV